MIEEHDYTIDDKFIFEQKTSLIYLKDDKNQSIELSKPASRLFNEILLLNIKKGIATRDELLTNVWEEYGLVGSNNNLNTYISEIRKKLEIIGIDPKSIVTVPKKGFRINSQITKFKIENNYHADFPIEATEPYENGSVIENSATSHLSVDKHDYAIKSHNVTTNPLVSSGAAIDNIPEESALKTATIPISSPMAINDKKQKNIKILFLFIITLVICFSIYFFFNTKTPSINQETAYLTVGTRGNCVIQTPADMIGKTTSDNIAFVNTKLEKYNISCEEPKRVILLSDLNKTYSFDKNIAISICKGEKDKYNCVSINDQRI